MAVSMDGMDDSSVSYVNEISCSELLCFLQNKSKVLAFDDLVNLCVDFYSVDEIECARVLLSKSVPQRMVKHKGQDKEKSKRMLVDMLKVCLDPLSKIPVFYAVDLTRLPPVGVEHVDMSALIQEVSALRNDVRNLTYLRSEIDELRKTVQLCAEKNILQKPASADIAAQGPVDSRLLEKPIAVTRNVEAVRSSAQIVRDSIAASALPVPSKSTKNQQKASCW
jgi:hypothetical protein